MAFRNPEEECSLTYIIIRIIKLKKKISSYIQDYLDDESISDDQLQGSTGSFTEEKWRNYGTHEAIQKSRQKRVRTRDQMAGMYIYLYIFV